MSDSIQQQPNLPQLIERLEHGSGRERYFAACALREVGAAAAEPLCNLLKHPNKNVRAQAAAILGDIGDSRAVQPLLDALRDCFVEGSSRLQLFEGFVLLILFTLLSISGLVIMVQAWSQMGMVEALKLCVPYGFTICLFFWLWGKLDRPHQVCQSISEALVRIAKREPTPELRRAIPDLSRMAADVMRQKRQTRNTARQAARNIATLTEQLKSLPIPAAEPAPDVKELPIPASESLPDIATLPRVEGHRR